MHNNISVVVMHSHTLIRKILYRIVNEEPDLWVVGEVGTGEQALQMACEYRPQVILLDSTLSNGLGLPLVQAVRRVSCETQIVLIGTQTQESTLLPALRAGARSYVTLDLKEEELTEVIRKAARGETVLTTAVATHLVYQLQTLNSESLPSLNEREQEIILLIAEAYNNADIAKILFLSENTVKIYVSGLLNKLSLTDRTQLAVYAWQQGLLENTRDTEPLHAIGNLQNNVRS